MLAFKPLQIRQKRPVPNPGRVGTGGDAYFLIEAFQKYGHGAGSTPSSLTDFAATALKSPIFIKGASV
jgi:hypothetical protein